MDLNKSCHRFDNYKQIISDKVITSSLEYKKGSESVQAIYAIYYGNDVKHIGQTSNLKQRFRDHFIDFKSSFSRNKDDGLDPFLTTKMCYWEHVSFSPDSPLKYNEKRCEAYRKAAERIATEDKDLYNPNIFHINKLKELEPCPLSYYSDAITKEEYIRLFKTKPVHIIFNPLTIDDEKYLEWYIEKVYRTLDFIRKYRI